jgi:hypothetical protein
MPDTLTKQDQFLLEEYKSAGELTFQMDSLRNKITSFFISFAGIAITGLVLIIKGNDTNIGIQNLNEIIGTIMLLVALIGHLFICVLAKIRKVQIEHFVIINNIRKHFIGDYDTLKEAVILSDNTLPNARFWSGSYYWQLSIQIVSSFMLATGVLLLSFSIEKLYTLIGVIIFSGTFILSIIVQHILYFSYAKYN